MAEQSFLKQLDYVKPYRASRLNVANWVMDHPEYMEHLVSIAFDPAHEKRMQALWGLEFVCRFKLEMLYPYLPEFFHHLPHAKEDNVLRAISFICELISIACFKMKDPILGDAFTRAQKELMTEYCFDWLITEQKVACKVRAMTALYHLGTEFTWIHPELLQILQRDMHDGSAGYKARGRHTMALIEKLRA
ncbi:MAG: hypothetical protein KJO23_01775 [Bacteroidia bacterium]|nr:hypothetical protein [Bacteroidia bacterium]NNM23855.1 hypothetical protein [Flavobacteriaceae bacterium]